MFLWDWLSQKTDLAAYLAQTGFNLMPYKRVKLSELQCCYKVCEQSSKFMS